MTDKQPPAPHVVVLDIETQKSSDEVGGWGHIDKMRVAVAGVWDSNTGKTTIYYERDIDALVRHLLSADIVVGFNLLRFDYQVLSGYNKHRAAVSDLEESTVDLLKEIDRRLGHRLSLAAVVEETLGEHKSADGLTSIKWWKQGKVEKVARYCKKDVELTRDLFLHILDKGYIEYTSKYESGPLMAKIRMRLPDPWDAEEVSGSINSANDLASQKEGCLTMMIVGAIAIIVFIAIAC